MRIALVIAVLVALVAAAPATAAASAKERARVAAACKKKAKKKRGLTKAQRNRYVRRCVRRRTAPVRTTQPGTTAPGPLAQAPSVPAPDVAQPSDPGVPQPPATTQPLARLGVTAREFSLTLSRTQMPAGPAIVELVNFGEDPHNLSMEPAGGGAKVDLPETAAGERTSRKVTLPSGSYTLTCTLPTHEALGMKATLTVSP